MKHCGATIHSGCGCNLDIRGSLKEGLNAAFGVLDTLEDTVEKIVHTALGVEKKIVHALAGESCCKIPPPCWVPRCVGEVHSHVCPGGTATVRFRVTNCGVGDRVIQCDAVGKPADVANVKTVPAQLPLTSMERGAITVSFTVPADDPECGERELLVWVRGCKNHYLRWTVSTARRGVDCCHQIEIEDCPDLIHHWYDHFYCHHPCTAAREG